MTAVPITEPGPLPSPALLGLDALWYDADALERATAVVSAFSRRSAVARAIGESHRCADGPARALFAGWRLRRLVELVSDVVDADERDELDAALAALEEWLG